MGAVKVVKCNPKTIYYDTGRGMLKVSMTAKAANTLKQDAAKAGMTVSAYILMRCAE